MVCASRRRPRVGGDHVIAAAFLVEPEERPRPLGVVVGDPQRDRGAHPREAVDEDSEERAVAKTHQRRDVDAVEDGPGPEAAEAALSFYRPRAAELARVPVREAKKIVEEALRRQEGRGLPLVVVRADGEVHATRVHAAVELPSLAYATVLLPSAAGGLAGSGLPDASASGAVADVGDTPDRIRYVAAEPGDEAGDGPELPAWAGAAVELRILIPGDEDGCEEVTWVYALRRAGPDLAIGAGEMSWLGGVTQTLEEHGRLVGEAIRRIARSLGLETALVEALGLAGEWHDAGKSRRVTPRSCGPSLEVNAPVELDLEAAIALAMEFAAARSKTRARRGPSCSICSSLSNRMALRRRWDLSTFPVEKPVDDDSAVHVNPHTD